MKKLLVTGSSGLIGSEVVNYFCKEGWEMHGVDNNMRANFFGAAGDTCWNQQRLLASHKNFQHHKLDICDRQDILTCIKSSLSQMKLGDSQASSHSSSIS